MWFLKSVALPIVMGAIVGVVYAIGLKKLFETDDESFFMVLLESIGLIAVITMPLVILVYRVGEAALTSIIYAGCMLISCVIFRMTVINR